jgi:hypothetical protein
MSTAQNLQQRHRMKKASQEGSAQEHATGRDNGWNIGNMKAWDSFNEADLT